MKSQRMVALAVAVSLGLTSAALAAEKQAVSLDVYGAV